MPTYEYACTSCGEHVEVVQSFRDEPLSTCPACAGDLRKVFGSIGVVFKGSGFYKTDSRSAAKGSPSKVDTSTSSESAGPSKEKAAGPSSNGSSSEGSSGPKEKSTPSTGGSEKSSTSSSGTSSAAAS